MKKNNLAIVNSNENNQKDITLNDDGSTYVSIREQARRLNVKRQTLQYYLKSLPPKCYPNQELTEEMPFNPCPPKYDFNLGLTEEMQFNSCRYFAYEASKNTKTSAAIKLFSKVGAAGFRVYNYSVLNVPLIEFKLYTAKVKLKLVTDELETLKKRSPDISGLTSSLSKLRPDLERTEITSVLNVYTCKQAPIRRTVTVKPRVVNPLLSKFAICKEESTSVLFFTSDTEELNEVCDWFKSKR